MAEYDINYDDNRFAQVQSAKDAAISEMEQTYQGMIDQSDKYYQQQIDAANNYAQTQKDLQQANTDFAIDKIEQQKEQAQKDYVKQQQGAYTDWRKQSNEYGVKAEQMAAAGLNRTGFSESSQVSMYNTYQNRVTAARESYDRAVQNYNNSITEARLQNNAVLAEIAYNALQTQLELSLQGFQYKNSLVLDRANQKLKLDSEYYGRYQDVLNQINKENALQEEIRQFNENNKLQQQKFNEEIRQYNENLALQQAKLAEDKRQFDSQLALKQSAAGGSSGGSGRRSSGRSSSSTAINKPSSSTSKATAEDFDAPIASMLEWMQSPTTKSVLELGKGPLSPQGVVDQMNMGTVTTRNDTNGNLIFVNNTAGIAGGAAMNPKLFLPKK